MYPISPVSTHRVVPSLLHLLALSACASFAGAAEIVITGDQPDCVCTTSEQCILQSPDSSRMLRQLPGADVSSNGPLSGIASYRGLANQRVGIQIDGAHVSCGCPNMMDPPLAHAPRPFLDQLTMERGFTSVSEQAVLGSKISANTWQTPFNNDTSWTSHGRLSLEGSSQDRGHQVGLIAGLSNQQHRLQVGATSMRGGDMRTGKGRQNASHYRSEHQLVDYGWRNDHAEIHLGYRHIDTGGSGTPALPMDIVWVRGDRFLADGDISLGQAGDINLSIRAHHHDGSHVMDNFSYRDAPGDPARWRANRLTTTNSDIDVNLSIDGWQATLSYRQEDHESRITNPNNAMFMVHNYNDAEEQSLGLTVSKTLNWRGAAGSQWQLHSAIQIRDHQADAGEVTAPGMMGPQMLQNRFNAADRSLDQLLVDGDVTLTWDTDEEHLFSLSLGRGQRAPTFLEYYSWLPMPASGGLADGNNYVGNLELDPETVYQADLGWRWSHQRGFLEPHAFIRYVDGFIQGTPSEDATVIMVGTMNGDSTPLQWHNVDALIMGFDLAGQWQLNDQVAIDSVISYQRGQRRDISDDLYRIPPLHGTIGITWTFHDWEVNLTAEGAAEQHQVADSNDEATQRCLAVTT